MTDEPKIERLRRGLGRALQEVGHALAPGAAPARGPLTIPAPEPPVVARIVVEVRSDGTQTIARGALECVGVDGDDAERVAIEARGTTPALLAASLARAIAQGLILRPTNNGDNALRALVRRKDKA